MKTSGLRGFQQRLEKHTIDRSGQKEDGRPLRFKRRTRKGRRVRVGKECETA